MAALKFGRNYTLSITVPESPEPIILGLPFTFEFEVVRNDLASASHAHLRIYNLGKIKRDMIRKAPYDINRIMQVQLNAGYGTTADLPIIFKGYCMEAWSVREGVNFITELDCYDGGYAYVNAKIDIAFAGGTSYTQIITAIANQIVSQTPGLSIGLIDNFPGSLPPNSGNSYSGTGCDLLKELTGNGFYIDNGKIYCLLAQTTVSTFETVINSASGLLETPQLEFPRVITKILFEPKLGVGQKVRLETDTTVFGNQDYKIISIAHRGIISPAVSGDALTTLGLVSTQFLVTNPSAPVF